MRPLLGQGGGERIDHVEHAADLAFVMRKRNVLRKCVGDHHEPRGRKVLYLDMAAGFDLVVLVGHDFDGGGFVFQPVERTDDARTQAAQGLVLFHRRQAHQHGDAIAKQHRVALTDTEGERHSVDQVAALKSERVDALAKHEGVCGQPCPAGRRGCDIANLGRGGSGYLSVFSHSSICLSAASRSMP